MTAPGIAIAGMACRYPDASTPAALWENVLARRRAFRRIPPERLRLEDYWSADRRSEDATYAAWAAVLDGYTFDRVRFRVSADTFTRTDIAHWVALEVASDALADAGFGDGDGLPRATTGVLVGNSLTGDFSRALSLRLRWPYVRRVLDATLQQAGEPPERRAALMPAVESAFKAPFPPPDAESLAGGLSNTIAGRICNCFDLQGGGYTVDGACASSLLAVAQACSALAAGDLDVAVAGGIDLSLDPFELVGFAKVGALAVDDMRIYDAAPTGFWPGEGCGFVVLMRETDVSARQRVYAVIRGWGVSSDGSGGMTRPERDGQMLALERAYARAGFGIETVGFFEGHGTGTAVGDATELAALAAARRQAPAAGPPAALGSIKANIGHTKAAAGVAGLLKAALALDRRVLPPTTGCRTPAAALSEDAATLRILEHVEPWVTPAPRRAGVSAMGFGGINVHVALEETAPARAPAYGRLERQCDRSAHDAELFVLGDDTAAGLCERIDRMAAATDALSLSELTDLAVRLQCEARPAPWRAAVVAATPAELRRLLRRAREAIAGGATLADVTDGVVTGHGSAKPRIGFLFTGQGAPVRVHGGAWSRRFEDVERLYQGAALPPGVPPRDTALAQPAIVAASYAALRVLERLGVVADVAIGHSLGELTALEWAGVLPAGAALELARTRGGLMASHAKGPGTMASLSSALDDVERLVRGTSAVVAAINAPARVVISGPTAEIERVVLRARAEGISAVLLDVSHAFHSPLMGSVAAPLRDVLASIPMRAPERQVVSTVTGGVVRPSDDVRRLLETQLSAPVRFTQAMAEAGDVDLWIEVGPGDALAGLVALCTVAPAVAVDASAASLRRLLSTIATAFAYGAPVHVDRLAVDRFARPFDLDRPRAFLRNPCEVTVRELPAGGPDRRPSGATPAESGRDDTCLLLRTIVGRRADLPAEAIDPASRFLSDLHLNSLTVGELLAEAARRVGAPPLMVPTDFADASLAEAAQAIDASKAAAPVPPDPPAPAGLGPWVRAFVSREEETAVRRLPARRERNGWRVVAAPGHPLGEALRTEFESDADGPGTIVCLDAGHSPSVALLLAAAKAELRARRRGCFLIVQQAAGASGFARTLFLESGLLDVSVITLPFDDSRAAAHLRAEARAAHGFTEARYDADGRRYVPVVEMLPLGCSGHRPLPIGRHDVLLVTGGAKGIAVECALGLAKETGVLLALIGRSRPEDDPVLSANLARLASLGVIARYVAADVCDPRAVASAVDTFRSELGEVTAVLHAAGRNEPTLIAGLDDERVAEALRPKVDGAANVLAAVSRDRLRLFVAFGSIIARTGLPGEAHYALANERLRELTARVASERPHCRALAIEWSIWAAPGMGERLGRLDALARDGVATIDVSSGVRMLKELIAAETPASSVLVAGRLGTRTTLAFAGRELPFRRFLEVPRVHIPDVELVADAQLSAGNDPYLADHQLEGQLLFPAVMGIEAMAQAAMALANTSVLPVIEDVEFARPVVVAGTGATLRTAALRHPNGDVHVALRTSATAFAADHFRAVCRWPAGTLETAGDACPGSDAGADGAGADPESAQNLYGHLLFQSGSFARLRGFQTLRATESEADIGTASCVWFGPHVPDTFVLGDPGARDASLHSIQACIPQSRVVPIAVRRVRPLRPLAAPCRARARQRSEDRGEFVWDLTIVDAAGRPLEVWEGLRLRSIGALSPRLGASLLGPYVERRLAALGHRVGPRVVLVRGRDAAAPAPTEEALVQLLGPHTRSWHRPDGRPETGRHEAVSVAHAGALTLAVAAPGTVGCDLEPVRDRAPDVWLDLLGSDRTSLSNLIAHEQDEPPSAAATRVWAALESLKKAGAPTGTPLLLDRRFDDGWVTLRAGPYAVSTWITDVERSTELVLAVVTGASDACL